jgi:hypothetical protein
VVVPAGPRAFFEVVKAEGVFEFAVVLLDPPGSFASATRYAGTVTQV